MILLEQRSSCPACSFGLWQPLTVVAQSTSHCIFLEHFWVLKNQWKIFLHFQVWSISFISRLHLPSYILPLLEDNFICFTQHSNSKLSLVIIIKINSKNIINFLFVVFFRGLVGYRSVFSSATRGTGFMHRAFLSMIFLLYFPSLVILVLLSLWICHVIGSSVGM